MVILHVKQLDESLFLLSTELTRSIDDAVNHIVAIQNGREKVNRLVRDMKLLCEYGPSLPPEMHGLLDEQIKELKLKDEWSEQNNITELSDINKDPCNIRCGTQPNEKHCALLQKYAEEAKGIVSNEKVKCGINLSIKDIESALDILKGAILMVYPMNLPMYDPIRCEIENRENLTETQDASKVLDPSLTQLWFGSKPLKSGFILKDYFGSNEKTKVIVKLQHKSQKYPPPREPLLSEEQQRAMMCSAFKRREELKKLEENDDDSYLNSNWADPKQLQRNIQGLTNIAWKP